MVTIKDVAKRAGVSIAAVSYALNNKEGVNEATKVRIKQIAEEMGYIPNSLAQGLLSKKTNIIGVLIPDISNTYTSNFIKYLDIYARKNGFFLLLGSLVNSTDSEMDVLDKLIAKKVDGFIITPSSYDSIVYKNIADKLNKRGIPFLFSNLSFPTIKSSFIVPDLEDGEYQITKYLLDEGFKDLVFVNGKKGNYYSDIRYSGFLRAHEEHGIKSEESNYIECGNEFDFRAGYNLVGEFLKTRKLPEVFVALNDVIAYGIIKGLKELGIKVPEDVGVVGFDDIDAFAIDTVPLTTVRIPIEEIAKLCIETIKDSSEQKVFKQFILATELVVRDSAKFTRMTD